MKEPDTPLPKTRSAVQSEGQSGLKLARQGPLRVRFEGDQSSRVPRVDVERETTATPIGDESRVFLLTRHCPACQRGMVAPGIRHSVECRRLRYAFDHPDLAVMPSPDPTPGPALPRTDVPEADDMEIESEHLVPREADFTRRLDLRYEAFLSGQLWC